MRSQLVHQLVDEWSLPKESKLITREGKEVDISSDTWQLPYSTRDYSTLNFNKIINIHMKDALKSYTEDRLRCSGIVNLAT